MRRAGAFDRVKGFPVIGFYGIAAGIILFLFLGFIAFAIAQQRHFVKRTIDQELIAGVREVERYVELQFEDMQRTAEAGAQLAGEKLSKLREPEDFAKLTTAIDSLLQTHDPPCEVYFLPSPDTEQNGASTVRKMLPALRIVKSAKDQPATFEPLPSKKLWSGKFEAEARQVLRQDKALSGEPFQQPQADDRFFPFMQPFFEPVRIDDVLAGVAVVTFSIEPIARQISNWSIGDYGYAMIFQKEGLIVSMQEQAKLINLLLPGSMQGLTQPMLGTMEISDPLAGRLKGGEVPVDHSAGEKKLLAASQRIDGTPIFVAGFFSLEEMASYINRRTVALLAPGLVIFVGAAVTIFFLYYGLNRPLWRFIQTTSRPLPAVTEENMRALQAQTNDGPRELRILAHAFNRLVDTIRGAVHSKNEYSKKLENSHQQLTAFNRQLEKIVDERTAEANRARVAAERDREVAERARVLAEEASEAKSNFLANISHELRTPLNAIIGYAELLMEDAVDEANDGALADLKNIQTAGQHLLSLINDVLDIAKIEAGRMKLEVETFGLVEMLDEVVQAGMALALDHRNEFIPHIDVGEVQMVADRTKVKQILLNLVGNACKFTERGTVKLAAKGSLENGRPSLICEVEDTGIGMTQEQVSRIFEKFSQADETSTRRYGGTGLGLFICREFTKLMAGEIQVRSQVNRGSVFTLILPLDVPQRLRELEERDEQTGDSTVPDPGYI